LVWIWNSHTLCSHAQICWKGNLEHLVRTLNRLTRFFCSRGATNWLMPFRWFHIDQRQGFGNQGMSNGMPQKLRGYWARKALEPSTILSWTKRDI
jgi:hypothetical protein